MQGSKNNLAEPEGQCRILHNHIAYGISHITSMIAASWVSQIHVTHDTKAMVFHNMCQSQACKSMKVALVHQPLLHLYHRTYDDEKDNQVLLVRIRFAH